MRAIKTVALSGAMLFVSGILLWNTGRALKSTAAPMDGGEIAPLTRLSGFANRLSISLFLILITLAVIIQLWHRTSNSGGSKKNTNRAWIAGGVIAFTVIFGLIIYVDPRGLYGTNIYEPRLLLVRDDKLNAYTRLATTPDVVVLGSSRAFTLLPEFFEQDLGYSAFNMSVEGGRMEDYEIQTKFILDHDPKNPPKVLMIEITPPLIIGSDEIARRMPLRLLQYMDSNLIKKVLKHRIEGLLDLQQFNEALYSLHYYMSEQIEPTYWIFNPDGGGSVQSSYDLQYLLQQDIANWKVQGCPHQQLLPEGIRHLEAVVHLAEEHNLSVILYITPRHPDYYNELMAENRHYLRCETILQTYMQALMDRYPFVFYLNYSRLEQIGGVADETGYYDSQHMTPLNNHYLLTAAAGTIRRAYTVAMQQRVQR